MSAGESMAYVRLEIQLLQDLPERALALAVEACLKGERSDGRFRPMPGELRREAELLCEPLRKQHDQTSKLLAASRCPATKLVEREKREELAAMLRSVVKVR
jgi:hypothetical protein